MIELSGILPPSDLLQKTHGVESGLRQRSRLSAAGWFALLTLSAIQLTLEISKIGPISTVLEKGPAALTANWPLLLLLFLTVFSLLLVTWSKFWLRESSEPFRYTCSISPFMPIGSDEKRHHDAADEWLVWLPHDVTRLLNERVQRFLFAGETKGESGSAKGNADEWDSYIHIRGHYVIRGRSNRSNEHTEEFEIEVMPRIRIGPPTHPEVMARSTVFVLPANVTSGRDHGRYVDLLEAVYHAIVTEVYRQLKDDVQRKIELLPTARFRAIALLHEADDYARSNTLRAYEEARELYRQAAAIADPGWRPLPSSAILRTVRTVHCRVHTFRAALRKIESRYRPGVAALDLLSARALTGYARMLLFRRLLSGIVGHAINPVFEVPLVVTRAVTRIESLGADVPGRAEALFDARVALALACEARGDTVGAREALDHARGSDPDRAERDPVFVYTSSLISPTPQTRLGLLRRSVELSPRFEVAQFQLAIETEKLWRSRDSFEDEVADTVLSEYRKLLQINPGNLGGWANSGYVCWLLGTPGRLEEALGYFEQGLRFKGVEREIFVAELDYGMARIFGERGDVVKAYEHEVSAISALVSRESTIIEFRDYFFEPMTEATRRRFDRYAATARKRLFDHLLTTTPAGAKPGQAPTRRICESVHAFVLNDLGESYRSSDVKKAKRLFRKSIRRNPNNVLPLHNLGTFETGNDRQQLEYLKRVMEVRPRWPQGRLALVRYYAQAAPDAVSELRQAEEVSARIESVTRELAVGEATDSTRAEQIRKTQLSLGAPDLPDTARRGPDWLERRDELNAELRKLDQQRDDHQRKAEEKTERAHEYREDARELARSLLPHDWLWTNGDINTHSLTDPRIAAEWRWQRELNDLHVQALYNWTLRFVYDKQETTRALEFLNHIRTHYWPANPVLLINWLNLKLRDAGRDLPSRKACALEALAANPVVVALISSLDDVGFEFEEQEQAYRRALEINSEIAPEALRERLADLYARTARVKTEPAAASAWYRKAADVQPMNARRHSDLAEALERAAAQGNSLLLEDALASAERAQQIAPSNIQYVAMVDRLREQVEAIQRRQHMSREIDERFGPNAAALRVPEQPLLVEYSDDLESVFRPTSGTDEATVRNTALDNLDDGLFYELGVRFPRPTFQRLRGPERNRYAINLWGIPMVAGELKMDRWLFSSPVKTLRAGGISATDAINPANGNVASWVDAMHVETARAYADQHGILYWRPFEYVVLHLASVLRYHVMDYLRVDDVLRMMTSWGLERDANELRQQGLLIELTNALRALVVDQFRLFYPEAAIKAFRAAYSPDLPLTDIVEQMRRHPDVRKQNAYFRGEYPLVRLGARFEEEIDVALRRGKHRVLAIEPKIAQKLLTTVRNYVLDLKETSPFLLCTPSNRPWVRKLVELEFPHFRVVSEPEVLPEGVERIVGTLEYED